MSRPDTLSSAAERIRRGVARRSHPEFLDMFYGGETEARMLMLGDEPPPTGDARMDALMGAVCEYWRSVTAWPACPDGPPVRSGSWPNRALRQIGRSGSAGISDLRQPGGIQPAQHLHRSRAAAACLPGARAIGGDLEGAGARAF